MHPTLFVNGRFWPTPGGGEAGALMARGGRIEALYREGEVPALEGAPVVDLGGRTAIPGLVDAHCHLVSYGMNRLREADLRGADSLAELGRRLREQAERQGLRPGDRRWLLGRGFEQDRLAEGRWPTRHDLDEIAPGVPVRISRICGHALVASTAALQAAGLDPAERRHGFPEGVLTENDMGPIFAAVPGPSSSEWLEAARRACAEAASVGFTGIHSLMAHEREVRALLDLRAEGPLPVRVVMQLPFSLLEHAAGLGLRTGFGDEYLRIGAVKLFSDGSLGARTAALREPYADEPGTCGQLLYEPDELTRRVKAVTEAGFQVCIHAIGDRAMDVTLDAIEAAAPHPFPPRIEHASMVNSGLVARMRALGVGAAVQPQFAWSDYWTPDRVGPERARGCYAFRTLHEAGVPLAGSTDCPVETLDAMTALEQLVHRPPWLPEDGLPLAEALRVFSEGSYALLGGEGGRLQSGDYADFVVLEQDPREVAPSELARIPVARTVVGGRTVFGQESA
ncbi:MAG: amidohydrolase [Armatimonadota bacterium]